ncbi:MAG TPA: GNAT family N-acetyltransferase [Longimicrobium sp.]|nr:GNAT family N-acetyltransferase [Longimicrobium sp.]
MQAQSPELTIRRATDADTEALTALALRSFLDAFAAQNRPEDIAAYTSRVYGAAQQRAEIADPNIVTLLGEMDGQLAAYAQLRWIKPGPDVTGPEPVEIMRFYVDQPWHGRGVAQRMMDAAFATAHEAGVQTVWLAVWEHNPRAIAFYQRRGFRVVGAQDFWMGSDRQNDFVMTRPLDLPHDP